MGNALNPRVWSSGPYLPTVPRTGGEGDNVTFRKHNLITRGRDGRYYEEVWTGLGNLNENIEMTPLTGTLGLTAGSGTVVGDGTIFQSECHLGQFICAIPNDSSASWLLVVRSIEDDTHMTVWKAPHTTIDGLTGWQMPILFAVNEQRGTALRGNVLKLDKGSFIGVGSGTFKLNGQVLPGTSLTLGRTAKIALYDPATNTYSAFPLGLQEATPPGLAAVGGGTKGMQGGNFSIVVTEARKETVGFGNPSIRADVTIATNDQVACTFAPLNTPGANARIVWVTTFADTLGADLNYLNGPWKRLRLIDDTEVPAAGGTINLEWLDAEVEFNEIVSFNNDPPTDAEFVEFLNKIPVWISCQGQGNQTHPAATSPGPFIVPAKPTNIEAAPLDLAFSSSPPETILGAVSAQGRIYLPTINKLQIAQSTPSDAVPILIRPFWFDGFANPYQVVFVNGILYGYPVAGPSRSAGDGDPQEAERNWAADVAEIIASWNPGQVLVGFDPENDAVVFFHCADRLNAAGFWTTRWLMYGIPQQFWIGDGEIGAEVYDDEGNIDPIDNWNTRDNIVSGVATISDRLDVLISGRPVGS